jgi:hypothetical protein
MRLRGLTFEKTGKSLRYLSFVRREVEQRMRVIGKEAEVISYSRLDLGGSEDQSNFKILYAKVRDGDRVRHKQSESPLQTCGVL